ncbi:MAG: silent information regulator protein Sir2 [Planctomycetaceae bacterium]|nr:silent information regulator protein Sir2 [Planctomycetaceae bacterium]
MQTNPRLQSLPCLVATLALLGSAVASQDALAQQPLRFEAEDITEPKDAWQVDKFSEDKWNLWSTDKDAEKKWSEGVVLQSPRVMQDRAKPEDGAPVLHAVVKDIKPGKYYVDLGGVSRAIGISFDGKTWQRIEGSKRNLGLIEVGEAGFELWLDDRYASAASPGSCYFDYLQFTPLPDPNRKPKVEGFAKTRVEEPLGRGIVALPKADGSIYVGWRLLKGDSEDTAFNIYRRSGSDQRQLNDVPLAKTTDFVDKTPAPGVKNEYVVAPVVGGKVGRMSEIAAAVPSKEGRDYVAVKLDGDHTFQKCGIADLNGDGVYDYVIKQPNSNIDPYEKYWNRSPDTYKIEAYLADGTFLWRYDMGWAIERGIWYSPWLAYDLDGDGKAEVCVKAGEGDPRDQDGRVASGPEYLLILDGMTGKETARVEWPDRGDFPSYNYASRNQMAVAFLDGKTPSLLVVRGTYNVIQVRAYEYQSGKLRQQWRWNDAEEGGRYRGQGAHSMHAADIDGDGRDEVFLGSAVLDDNGVGLWSTGLGHPDHHYVGDIDPSRPGLEVYYGIEARAPRNGCCLVDARTGEILWGLDVPTRHVHSTGMCADIDATVPGIEAYSSDTDAEKKSNVRWLFDAKGNILRDDLDWGFGFKTVHWDADLQHEILRGRRILNYGSDDAIAEIEGSAVGYADVLGDWREELIVTVPGELRIYTTTIPAADRRVCLMQDPLYRIDVCLQAMGYTQCPMTTKCLSAE